MGRNRRRRVISVIAGLTIALLAVNGLTRVGLLIGIVRVRVGLVRVGLVRALAARRILLLVLSVGIHAVAGIRDRRRLSRGVTNAAPSTSGGQGLSLSLWRRRGWLGVQGILGPNQNRRNQERSDKK